MNEPALPPEKWRYLFDKIDVEFGYRPLATHIKMDHTRLRRLLLGGGTTNEAIEAVADAFKVKPNVIRELRGEPPIEYEPFTLPDDAGRLNHNERNVIRAVIRALLEARDERNVLESASASGASAEAEAQEALRRRNDPERWAPGTTQWTAQYPRVDPGKNAKNAE